MTRTPLGVLLVLVMTKSDEARHEPDGNCIWQEKYKAGEMRKTIRLCGQEKTISSVWWSLRTNLIQITRVVLVSGHKGAGSLCEDVVKRDKLRRFISKRIHKIEMRDFQPLALAIFKAKECFVSSL